MEGTIFEIAKNKLKQADDYEVKEYVRIMLIFKYRNNVWVYVATE